MQRYIITIPGFAANYHKWEHSVKTLNCPYTIIEWFEGFFKLIGANVIEKITARKELKGFASTLLDSLSSGVIQASETVADEVILNKDKTIVILAHSMGTMIAVKALSLLPSRHLPSVYVALMSGIASINDFLEIPKNVISSLHIFNFYLEKDKVLHAFKTVFGKSTDPIGLKPVTLKSIVNVDASKIGIQEHTDYVNNLKRVYEAIFALNN